MQTIKPRLLHYGLNHRGLAKQSLTSWSSLPSSLFSTLHSALCAAVRKVFKHLLIAFPHSCQHKNVYPLLFPKEIPLQLILQAAAPALLQCLHTEQIFLSFSRFRISSSLRPFIDRCVQILGNPTALHHSYAHRNVISAPKWKPLKVLCRNLEHKVSLPGRILYESGTP